MLIHTSFSMANTSEKIDRKIDRLLGKMSLQEKIGQMNQRHGADGHEEPVRNGQIGSILNEVDTDKINRLQKIAVEESPHGIPLLIARDVIHGFRTIFPIPLGLAATWNPELIRQGTRVAAEEAASVGINWTFAPMMDISRDPRWGRIAECFGEDTYLTNQFSVAMINGFQTNDLTRPDALAACAKHFVGYGAGEGGRDYNTVYIPEQLLREVYLKPFRASVEAGVATLMPAFNDLNGIPATGNSFLLRKILRDEWGFDGLVVSDWAAIEQMIPHGYCADLKDAGGKALQAGIDMEMATTAYEDYLAELVETGVIDENLIDQAVRNILRVKFRLGLFENPYTDPKEFPALVNDNNLKMAKETALQSIVLLKNDREILPLSKDLKDLAVIGPLADDPFEQLGTWTFDKNIEDTQTPLTALGKIYNRKNIHYIKALETSRTKKRDKFDDAVKAAEKSDVILFFGGEEAIITGEAHCRANIDLPGAQEALIHELAKTGKPIVLVVMAGRPLTMGNILDKVDAVLFAFHPGTMGGPAIADLLTGDASPSGKLPVTFPKVVGQIPLYYNHKNTGRPPSEESFVHIDDIPVRAWQTSLGNESHYIDAGFKPQFPFGFGLSYTDFDYTDLKLSKSKIKMGEPIKISARISNKGTRTAEEVVQLYTRDMVASITPPVRELKGFQRILLKPGESKRVTFTLTTDELAFFNQQMEEITEPGEFQVWIAANSATGLSGKFEVVE
ncbi:MAG: beta-glucosidase BglX [Fidelibacterota bacterium]